MPSRRFWRWYDRGSRLDFAGNLLGYVFDWKAWIVGIFAGGGGAATFLWAAIDGRSPLDVWVVAVVVAAALATFVYFVISILEKLRKREGASSTAPASPIAIEGVPDVRVADDLIAWRLFDSPERDKLFPLLEDGKIQAWGRLGNGHPPLMKIPAESWRTNYIHRTADPLVAGRINQTFMKSKARHETSYYDVYLNNAQLKNFWPKLWDPISLYDAASFAYGETRGSVISDMAEQDRQSPLFWYVYHFFAVSQIPVFGRKKFSAKREQIPTIKGFAPQLRNGNEIILKDIYGDRDWENITIDSSDLIKDFESLRKTASEVPQ